MDLQTILVILIIAVTAFFLIKRAAKRFGALFSNSSSCESGCGKCSSKPASSSSFHVSSSKTKI